MYNVDFLPQLKGFREDLFSSSFDLREASDEAHLHYIPPPGIEYLECEEDTNGEWVPKRKIEDGN